MKKIIFLCLLCEVLIHSAQAQYIQSPTSYSYLKAQGRVALQIPATCGKPVTATNAPDSSRAAVAVDTCNDLFYFFNPMSKEWETIQGGGGDTNIFYFSGDTTIINKIKIKNVFVIPLTDTTNAIKGCGNIIYDTLNEHYYGDVCLDGTHNYWGCFDCASGGSTITLQTNGVDNGDQTLLNLQEGTGINITDNGTGTVTIDATGISPIEIDTTVTLDGLELIVTVPHSLGSPPTDVRVLVDNEAGLATFLVPYFDDTNIYIPYSIGPICTCAYKIFITP